MDNIKNELLALMQKAKSVYSPDKPECPFTFNESTSLEELMKVLGIKK